MSKPEEARLARIISRVKQYHGHRFNGCGPEADYTLRKIEKEVSALLAVAEAARSYCEAIELRTASAAWTDLGDALDRLEATE